LNLVAKLFRREAGGEPVAKPATIGPVFYSYQANAYNFLIAVELL
jgi:hypothetical protein